MKGLAVALLALATRAAAEVTVEAKPQITYFTTLSASGNYGHYAWKPRNSSRRRRASASRRSRIWDA